jgi:hypothetical protein
MIFLQIFAAVENINGAENHHRLTYKRLFDFLLPNAEQFVVMLLNLDKFPFTLALMIKDTFELIQTSRKALDLTRTFFVAFDEFGRNDGFQVNNCCFVRPSWHSNTSLLYNLMYRIIQIRFLYSLAPVAAAPV